MKMPDCDENDFWLKVFCYGVFFVPIFIYCIGNIAEVLQ